MTVVVAPARKIKHVFPYDHNPKDTYKGPFQAWNSDQWFGSDEQQWRKDAPPGYPPKPYDDSDVQLTRVNN